MEEEAMAPSSSKSILTAIVQGNGWREEHDYDQHPKPKHSHAS